MAWTRSLGGQFLVFQLLVVAVVLFAVAAVSVTQPTREFRDVRGQRMSAVAETMAADAPQTPVAAGEIEIQATVRLTAIIEPR